MEEENSIQVEGNGNGHNPSNPVAPYQVKQALSMGAAANLFGQKDVPNAIAKLVDPGRALEDMLMRGKFRNRAERIAAMHIAAQCKEFNDTIAERELFFNVAATVSEYAEGRKELVAAIIGDQQLKQQNSGFGDMIRNAAFGKKKDDA